MEKHASLYLVNFWGGLRIEVVISYVYQGDLSLAYKCSTLSLLSLLSLMV
jgi:hypothetical protein